MLALSLTHFAPCKFSMAGLITDLKFSFLKKMRRLFFSLEKKLLKCRESFPYLVSEDTLSKDISL